MINRGEWEITDKIYLGGFQTKKILRKDQTILERSSLDVTMGDCGAAMIHI
jgi:hypothetical protein